MTQLHPVIREITERIKAKSAGSRRDYLERMQAAHAQKPQRTHLSCGNLAHGFAACNTRHKQALTAETAPNIGIVSAYNDMLSAHQPYGDYPALI
ncbi:MAG: phosphogluconate dehydratase, partial [Pseudomonadota bacterium]